MEPTHIDIKGARVHNLQNVSLRIPRNQLICFTGVSGSGKSSLAFDTLFAEGQRRYIESLSSYARQFLGQVEKPDCDLISGLSPAIAIEQKAAGQNPRSTVGTITAIYDFLRVLYARTAVQHCTNCGRPISAQSREQIITAILSSLDGQRALILAPIARGQKGEFRDTFGDLVRAGYVRARVDGEIVELRNELSLEKNKRHDIEVMIDRLAISSADRPRLAEAVESALRVGDGTLIVLPADEAADSKAGQDRGRRRISPRANAAEQLFSSKYACTACSLSYEPPTPQHFSFNSPTGMCLRCDGLGEMFDFEPALLIPDDSLDFLAPCIVALRHPPGRWRRHIYEGVARHVGFDLHTPWRELPKKARDALLYGTGDAHITFEWRMAKGLWKHGGPWEGVIAELQEKYRKAGGAIVRTWYEKFMRRGVCPECGGQRLNAQARHVRLKLKDADTSSSHTTGGRREIESTAGGDLYAIASRKSVVRRSKLGSPTIASSNPSLPEVCSLPVQRVLQLLDALDLTPVQQIVAQDILKELRARLGFLLDVGLHYLSIDRTAPTLSGGEAQRIRLAGQIGSGLTGVLYVLDEPSIGLHPRDNRALLDSLLHLRDLGNTVIVVEHDEETMRAADHVVDFGPGPGIRGGNVVAEGTCDEIAAHKDSITGAYLRGDRRIEIPAARRPVKPPQNVKQHRPKT